IDHARNRLSKEYSVELSATDPPALKHFTINQMNSTRVRRPPCTPCATNSLTMSAELTSAVMPVAIQCAVNPVPMSHHSPKWRTAASMRAERYHPPPPEMSLT